MKLLIKFTLSEALFLHLLSQTVRNPTVAFMSSHTEHLQIFFSFHFLLLCKVEIFPKAVTEKEKKIW